MPSKKKTMNILVSSNEMLMKPLVVSLTSLHENTNSDNIQIYFINVSLLEPQVQWLKRKLAKYPKFSLHVTEVSEKNFEGAKLFGHFSVEIYARLLLMKILPKNIDRILWLDADTVVHNNIDSFYYMDINGYSLVACESINQNIGELRQKLQMGEMQKYFNSGILLFNLSFLREHFTENSFMDYALANMDKIKWPDQDVLNAMCGRSARIIDYHKYNYMHFSSLELSDEEWKQIKKENCILHFIGAIKPWQEDFQSRTFSLWRHYALKSGLYPFRFFLHRAVIRMMKKIWKWIRYTFRLEISLRDRKNGQ